MPLHTEAVCDDLRNWLQNNLGGQIATLFSEGGPPLNIDTPAPANYFLGNPAYYRDYQLPAIFIDPTVTDAVNEATTGSFDNVLRQDQLVTLTAVYEAFGVEEVTRGCMRLAQALVQTLRDQDVTALGITVRSTKCFIPRVSYSAVYVPINSPESRFRKDVRLSLIIKQWDDLTTLPIQIGVGGGAITVGAIGTGTTVVASKSDLSLTTTNPTTVVTFTAANGGANYSVQIYFRVSTSSTTVTVTVAYTDNSSAQTATIASGVYAVGSFSTSPLFFNAASGTSITVTATASVANQVAVSAVIEQL